MDSKALISELEKVINTGATFDTKVYLESIKRLDVFSKEQEIPSKLKHYLSRRSYLKAYEFLKHST